MTLVQKVKAKVRRSGSTVNSIYIPPDSTSCRVLPKTSPEESNSQTRALLEDELLKAYEEISLFKVKEQELQAKIDEKDEQILILEELLSRVKNDKLKEDNRRYQESLKKTKQFIENLETEVQSLTAQMKEMKSKSEGKVERMKSRLLQRKQDFALKVFELREEILKLRTKNQQLIEQQERSLPNNEFEKQQETFCTVDDGKRCQSDSTNDEDERQVSRSRLVLELSEKINHLETENGRLRKKYKEAKLMIKKLQKSQTLDSADTNKDNDLLSSSVT